MHQGDGWIVVFVIVVLTAGIVVWLWRYFTSNRLGVSLPEGNLENVSEELAAMLEEYGFEVTGGKIKWPVSVSVDEVELPPAGIIVDAFATRNGQYYVVRIARPSQVMEWNAKSIRDRLLMYALLFPEARGIVYIDPDEDSLHVIEFEIDRRSL
ncbi:hypothetical protein [Paenibacillus sp. y28]|uniref:hypothetical protein n=1 Tax=Paenibacillus sp. y28 TaxID=3129110 RepID=UPI0030177F92